MADTPQQLDASQLDYIDHPTLGKLAFPKTMGAQERNSIIDGMTPNPAAQAGAYQKSKGGPILNANPDMAKGMMDPVNSGVDMKNVDLDAWNQKYNAAHQAPPTPPGLFSKAWDETKNIAHGMFGEGALLGDPSTSPSVAGFRPPDVRDEVNAVQQNNQGNHLQALKAEFPGVTARAKEFVDDPVGATGRTLVDGAAAAAPFVLPKLGLKSRSALAQKIVQPLVYEGVGEAGADARMGIHPDQALIDEGIWGTRKSMSQQLEDRIGQLKPAANQILNNAPGSTNWLDSTQHINSAINDAIATAKKDGITDFSRLENLRQSLLAQHGPTSGNPLSQNDLKSSIQQTAKRLGAYRNTVPSEASAADAAGEAARGVKKSVDSTVPEAVPLNQRMSNAIDAKSGLDRGALADKGKDLFAQGTTNKLFQRTIGSPLVRSGTARFISLGAKKDIPTIPPTVGPGPQFASPSGPPAAQAYKPTPIAQPVPAGPGILPQHAAEGPPLWNPAVGDQHPNSLWKGTVPPLETPNPSSPFYSGQHAVHQGSIQFGPNTPQTTPPSVMPGFAREATGTVQPIALGPGTGGPTYQGPLRPPSPPGRPALGPVAPPTQPPVPSNLTGAPAPSAPPAAPNVSAPQSNSAPPVLPPVPSSPINPQEVADYSKMLGRPVTAAEIPEIRARLDAERNVNTGLAGNRTDQIGNIRETHRATLTQPKRK